ncbi:MAG: hypothetical protein LBV12_11375, partial [Puniceicoccales bacterium]|nr:hypothetical protein [Puniceicoccales bacterium]
SRDGKPISCFEVSGADGKFFPADATISGKTVKVSCPNVSKPTQIRFAWKESAKPNLMNRDNLPASAFRYPTPKTPAK